MGKGDLNPAYKHGHTTGKFSPTYQSWCGMIQRCTNPKRESWKRYGGRGIKVCDRWMVFENFLEDMGERPAGLTLDREDNDGHYEPGNCRWADSKTQHANRAPYHVTPTYRAKVLELLQDGSLTLPQLYAAMDIHGECVKKEVRKLRKDGLISTEPVKGNGRGMTLLCRVK